MKKVLVFLLLIGLGLVGIAYVMNNRTQATVQPPRRERVEKGSIVEKVAATGKIVPNGLIYVSTDVAAARVVEILEGAEVGKEVQKDQSLVQLDDVLAKAKQAEAESAVLAAEATKVQAEAKHETAQAGLRQATKVYELARQSFENLLSRSEQASQKVKDEAEKQVNAAKEGVNLAEAQVKEAKSAILAAEANIQRAKAGVSAAQQYLTMMVVKAPSAGTIIERKVNPGQLIAPQLTPVLFVIAPDVNRMELHAQVAEADISKVKVGMSARFTVDAYAEHGTQFKARVRYPLPFVPTLPPTRALDMLSGGGAAGLSGPVFYTVTLDVLPYEGQEPRPLKAGMTANVDLIAKEVKDALVVPNQALNYLPAQLSEEQQKTIGKKVQEGWRPLWVYREGTEPRLVFVRTGATDGGKTEILQVEGELEAGTEIITEGPPQQENGGGLINLKSLRLS